MKKTLLIALVTILSVQVQAQLLWKVSGNGIERPSYIFGTHHLAPSDSILSAHPSIDAALQAVDCVYGEVLLSDMASAQNEVMAALQAPADSTLTDILTTAQLDSIGTLLTSYGIPPRAAARRADSDQGYRAWQKSRRSRDNRLPDQTALWLAGSTPGRRPYEIREARR